MRTLFTYVLAIVAVCAQGQNQLTSEVQEYWDGFAFTNSSKTEYSYTGDKVTQITYLEWQNSSWVAYDTRELSYNANNKISELIESYDDGTGFEDDYKVTYTYDASGNILETLFQEWDGSQWENDEKLVATYSGSEVSYLTAYEWDGTAFEPYIRVASVFSNSLLTEAQFEGWNGTQFEPSEMKQVFTYDASSNLAAITYEEWDGSAWVETESNSMNYDANNNRIKAIEEGPGFIEKREIVFDNSEVLSSYIHPFREFTGFDYFMGDDIGSDECEYYMFGTMPFVNKIDTAKYFTYDETTLEFTLSERTIFNYTTNFSLEDEANPLAISLLPNPASTRVTIEGLEQSAELTMYNTLGERVLSTEVYNKSEVDIHTLSPGLYFVTIDNKGGYRLVVE